MSYFGATFFSPSYFGNAYWGSGGTPSGEVVQHGDWQIRYTKDHGRRKRWEEETLNREQLRAIIRKAVLGEVPAVAEFVEYPPVKPPSDTAPIHRALSPESAGRATPFIDYDSILADMQALQSILSWHYKQQVEIAMADDDEAVIALIM